MNPNLMLSTEAYFNTTKKPRTTLVVLRDGKTYNAVFTEDYSMVRAVAILTELGYTIKE